MKTNALGPWKIQDSSFAEKNLISLLRVMHLQISRRQTHF